MLKSYLNFFFFLIIWNHDFYFQVSLLYGCIHQPLLRLFNNITYQKSLIIFGGDKWWSWIGAACVRMERSQLIISFSIVLSQGRYGPWSLVFLESIRLCWAVPWRSWNVGRVVLVIIGTSRFGELFLIVWCGAFGGVVLRIVNILMLRLSYSFYIPFLIGLMGGVFTLVFLFLISWSFVL